jgi:hypothetical protein
MQYNLVDGQNHEILKPAISGLYNKKCHSVGTIPKSNIKIT